ncbi:MAG: GntR family transcriptional regulator [Spirochaetaceae bacterium]|jgi:DNA-binding GntR family transcriptional regulator|nr:GntR family transcriptional regulator [Spirochaetaceae bacterium]
MGQMHITGESNYKTPAYVGVYERLYDAISAGLYKPGEQLPGEMKLASEFGVSRNTLRQALTILCEDGLIYSVQGSGNFVAQNYEHIPKGMENLDNLLFSAARVDCDEVRMLYNFACPAKVVQEKLNLTFSDITLHSNNIYYNAGTPIAHGYMEIPQWLIAELRIDLGSEESIHSLLNEKLFEKAVSSTARLTFTLAEEGIAGYLTVDIGTPLIFIEEVLYAEGGKAIALCKYYLLPNYYRVNITRKK